MKRKTMKKYIVSLCLTGMMGISWTPAWAENNEQNLQYDQLELPEKTETTTKLRVEGCEEWISLRSRPDTAADRITTIPLGEEVEYLSDSENGFYLVAYDNKTGYALSQYLTLAYENLGKIVPGDTLFAYHYDEDTSLRASDSVLAEELETIMLGQKVTFLDIAANGFCYVKCGDVSGYFPIENLTADESEVILNGDMLYVYNNESEEGVPLRTYPDPSSEIVEIISNGAQVRFIESVAFDYYYVKYGDNYGYFPRENLKKIID